MSVYGGFSTRKMETRYNELLYELLALMQSTLAKFIARGNTFGNAEQVDQLLFKSYFHRLYESIKQVETRKYLNPKFAPVLEGLEEVCYDHIDGSLSAAQLSVSRPIRLFTSKKMASARSPQERSMSIDSPANNYMPVTVPTETTQQIYNMKWPDKPIEVPMNVIGEHPEMDAMNDARKRIKSGVTYKNKPSASRKEARPNTSVQRDQSINKQGLQTIENQIEDLKEKSQTVYLAEERRGSSQQPRRESTGAIVEPRKKLYEQLEKYNSTLDISQHMAQLPPQRRKTTRMYRIAKLF